jgi:hypothetical protein
VVVTGTHPDVDLDARRRELNAVSGAVTSLRPSSSDTVVLHGVGASMGTATGRAAVIDDPLAPLPDGDMAGVDRSFGHLRAHDRQVASGFRGGRRNRRAPTTTNIAQRTRWLAAQLELGRDSPSPASPAGSPPASWHLSGLVNAWTHSACFVPRPLRVVGVPGERVCVERSFGLSATATANRW